jgi:hypothetical protein
VEAASVGDAGGSVTKIGSGVETEVAGSHAVAKVNIMMKMTNLRIFSPWGNLITSPYFA